MSLLERTLSEIAKPKWEGAPNFSLAWNGAVHVAQDLKQERSMREWGCDSLRHLAAARVLSVEREQVTVLPPVVERLGFDGLDYDKMGAIVRRLKPPWPSVFVDIGGVDMAVRHETPPRIMGAVVEEADSEAVEGVTFFVFVDASGDGRVRPYAHVRFDCARGELVTFNPLFGAESDVLAQHIVGDAADTVDDIREALANSAGNAIERVIAVLQWLESANVEIVDRPVSRQVRRNAERKGAEIAKVVRVRLPRSWRNGQPPQRSGAINFNHRFEVRGHYKFFPDTTRLGQADPTKLSWVPEREGYFRRIWCPPFVKGPADKPLVPKTRRLISA